MIKVMRKVFLGLAMLLMAAVLVQFFLAASGAFATAPKESAFAPHRVLGYSILAFAVVLTIVAAVARMPGRIIGMSGLVAGLVVVQSLIATLAEAFSDSEDKSTVAGQIVFGLHAINGLIILGAAERIIRRARALSTAPAQPVSSS